MAQVTLNEEQIIQACHQAVVDLGKQPAEPGRLLFDRATSLVSYVVDTQDKIEKKATAKKAPVKKTTKARPTTGRKR